MSPSAPKPRQPIIGWSSVVLLSALLLSPMTAGALWHAFAQRFPQAFAALAGGDYAAAAAATATPGDATADSGGTARRANDETPATRVAAKGARRAVAPDSRFPFQVRPATGARPVASLVPSASAWPDIADARARFRAVSPACPRAPPV